MNPTFLLAADGVGLAKSEVALCEECSEAATEDREAVVAASDAWIDSLEALATETFEAVVAIGSDKFPEPEPVETWLFIRQPPLHTPAIAAITSALRAENGAAQASTPAPHPFRGHAHIESARTLLHGEHTA